MFLGCGHRDPVVPRDLLGGLDLKRGEIISCGASGKDFGFVDFDMSCDSKVKDDFNVAMELLHSFEYDESEKIFAKIIDASPSCAMAYWGVAMCNFHPLWGTPTDNELQKGTRAIAIARSFTRPTRRESAYINAAGEFFSDWKVTVHVQRCIQFQKAMEQIYLAYPGDREAAIFYALALVAAADPSDKSFSNQKKAGSILEKMYPAEPNHPGILHYLIHTYDYPGLANLALPAARKYASVAPSSAHALHMPSHIFTRLGLWDECISTNLRSTEAATCYAQAAGINGHWDEELHGLDYLVYAYLQKGDNDLAKEQLRYLGTIRRVYPVNFKVAYAFAAIPARVALENRNWKEAAGLEVFPENFPWNKFPWQLAITHFARLMGSARSGNPLMAETELHILTSLYDTLQNQKDSYKSGQVAIQIKTGQAWIKWQKGEKENALDLMREAVSLEENTEKNPVTPGEVIPAAEWLGDMLSLNQEPDAALAAYELELGRSPNRFNGLYGAAKAAEKSGKREKASYYFRQLLTIADTSRSGRPEIAEAKSFPGK
jgi:tetratricopeptide (TPR) repeat protein